MTVNESGAERIPATRRLLWEALWLNFANRRWLPVLFWPLAVLLVFFEAVELAGGSWWLTVPLGIVELFAFTLVAAAWLRLLLLGPDSVDRPPLRWRQVYWSYFFIGILVVFIYFIMMMPLLLIVGHLIMPILYPVLFSFPAWIMPVTIYFLAAIGGGFGLALATPLLLYGVARACAVPPPMSAWPPEWRVTKRLTLLFFVLSLVFWPVSLVENWMLWAVAEVGDLLRYAVIPLSVGLTMVGAAFGLSLVSVLFEHLSRCEHQRLANAHSDGETKP